jgi:hypothetical protein
LACLEATFSGQKAPSKEKGGMPRTHRYFPADPRLASDAPLRGSLIHPFSGLKLML